MNVDRPGPQGHENIFKKVDFLLLQLVRTPLSRASGRRRRAVRYIVTLGRRILCLGLDGDFHVCTRFEADFLTLFIRERVVDAYFPIQMIRALNGYLSFFWFTWEWGLDNFFNRPRHDGTWFFAHNPPHEQ